MFRCRLDRLFARTWTFPRCRKISWKMLSWLKIFRWFETWVDEKHHEMRVRLQFGVPMGQGHITIDWPLGAWRNHRGCFMLFCTGLVWSCLKVGRNIPYWSRCLLASSTAEQSTDYSHLLTKPSFENPCRLNISNQDYWTSSHWVERRIRIVVFAVCTIQVQGLPARSVIKPKWWSHINRVRG